ncbi:MAG: hypothetical protein VZQ49_06965, partial [Methanobrevibacter sp.]|nr:hypothetical protein [Methanobrevibacter sp.]
GGVGWGVGGWGWGGGSGPQTPKTQLPNPQSPIPIDDNFFFNYYIYFILKKLINLINKKKYII